MTGQELYTFLYGWVATVIPGKPVVRAYQNAAKPATSFIAIEDDQSWTPFGREDRVISHAGTTSIVHHDYTVKPALWEVCHGDAVGWGDDLRALRESLGTQATKDLFFAAGVGILQVGQILSMPWLSSETEFVREKRMELWVSVSSEIADTVKSIATVELINQVGKP